MNNTTLPGYIEKILLKGFQAFPGDILNFLNKNRSLLSLLNSNCYHDSVSNILYEIINVESNHQALISSGLSPEELPLDIVDELVQSLLDLILNSLDENIKSSFLLTKDLTLEEKASVDFIMDWYELKQRIDNYFNIFIRSLQNLNKNSIRNKDNFVLQLVNNRLIQILTDNLKDSLSYSNEFSLKIVDSINNFFSNVYRICLVIKPDDIHYESIIKSNTDDIEAQLLSLETGSNLPVKALKEQLSESTIDIISSIFATFLDIFYNSTMNVYNFYLLHKRLSNMRGENTQIVTPALIYFLDLLMISINNKNYRIVESLRTNSNVIKDCVNLFFLNTENTILQGKLYQIFTLILENEIYKEFVILLMQNPSIEKFVNENINFNDIVDTERYIYF